MGIEKFIEVTGVFEGLKIPESWRGEMVAILGKDMVHSRDENYVMEKIVEYGKFNPDERIVLFTIPEKDKLYVYSPVFDASL